MTFLDFLAPFFRQKLKFLFTFFSFFIFFSLGYFLFPEIHKTTVYFTLRPVASGNASSDRVDYLVSNAIEEGSKVVETLAGWAQNPAFRDEILEKSGVYIPYFKQKISAKKQNRMNLFWTLKFVGEEKNQAPVITEAFLSVFLDHFKAFNDENIFPFKLSSPQISSELQRVPLMWFLVANFLISFFLAFGALYFWESFLGKISFLSQVSALFPSAPILRFNSSPQHYDLLLLKKFLLTFDSPALISLLKKNYITLPCVNFEDISMEQDFPILIVRLGETTLRDLENMRAFFGSNVGIVVFEN